MPLQIFTKEPTTAEQTGKQVIYFRRKKVTEDQAYRAVLVSPFTNLPTVVHLQPNDSNGVVAPVVAEEVFATAIATAFFDAAGSILRRFCEEQPEAKEVSEDLFTFPAIVTEMQASESGQRLNSEQIAEWYKGSATEKLATERYAGKPDASKKEAALRSAYLSLASNNSGIQPNLATKMLAYLAPEDTDSAVCKAIAKRLEKLSKANISDDL